MPDQVMTRTGVALSALERQMFGRPEVAGMNACIACCDRWVDGSRDGLRWFARDGGQTGRTFLALRTDAARFANLLTARGVGPGDVVAALLPPGAELLTCVLGTWRAGAVFQPLTSVSPAAINARINHTGRAAAKLIVTDVENRARFDLTDYCAPVLVVTNGTPVCDGDGDFTAELMRQSTCFAPVSLGADDPFVLLVGGRDGQVRPVMPKLRSLLSIQTSLQLGLAPQEADTGWDVADPAWSSALFFSVMRPLLQGYAAIAHESDSLVPAVTASPSVPVEILRRARSSMVEGELRLAA